MVTIEAVDPTGDGEQPEVLTKDTVQFWCKHTRSLEKPHIAKAKRFVEYDCIRYVGDDNEYDEKASFICLPLNTSETFMDKDTGREFHKIPFKNNYNNTLYTIIKRDGLFVCNCQGWTKREHDGRGGEDGCSCSHVLALFFCFKMKKFGKVKQ